MRRVKPPAQQAAKIEFHRLKAVYYLLLELVPKPERVLEQPHLTNIGCLLRGINSIKPPFPLPAGEFFKY
jgi:hypothetical protein